MGGGAPGPGGVRPFVPAAAAINAGAAAQGIFSYAFAASYDDAKGFVDGSILSSEHSRVYFFAAQAALAILPCLFVFWSKRAFPTQKIRTE